LHRKLNISWKKSNSEPTNGFPFGPGGYETLAIMHHLSFIPF
jgi:hypothetical protein